MKPSWWDDLSPGSRQEILRFPSLGVVASIAIELRGLGVIVPRDSHWVNDGPHRYTPNFDDETLGWIREESKRHGLSD
ncbi:hypothetical protein SAMN05216368_103396 [Cryobacterium flavum]|uniref:Uncharacterized protein n=1 Tax=Cryobacterium flavum TaxID=1424659 RepID=A0A5E9FWM0_9MICO|nr:hypothetical protein SAMN05216368_103396 [Cryobacterium flavum]